MPKGQHARIVKPRTAKQQAAIAKNRQFGFASFKSTRPEPGSTTSWWVGLDRTELNAQARAQQERMNATTFGRLTGSPTQEP